MKPLYRWVGGKRRTAPAIVDMFPDDFKAAGESCENPYRYWEPFVGGAAVYLELTGRGWTGNAWLGDASPHVSNALNTLAHKTKDVIDVLDSWERLQGVVGFEATYRTVQALSIEHISQAERAARFLYLQKKCYGGVWRVNSSGGHNVPPGSDREHSFYRDSEMWCAALAFQGAEIYTSDFRSRAINPKPGDVVYCDPPYYSAYEQYTEGGFGLDGHSDLARRCHLWAEDGVHVYVSNSDCPEVHRLYEGFVQTRFETKRNVQGSKAATELLLWSM